MRGICGRETIRSAGARNTEKRGFLFFSASWFGLGVCSSSGVKKSRFRSPGRFNLVLGCATRAAAYQLCIASCDCIGLGIRNRKKGNGEEWILEKGRKRDRRLVWRRIDCLDKEFLLLPFFFSLSRSSCCSKTSRASSDGHSEAHEKPRDGWSLSFSF